jgi:FAD/FMN-containing dehydrogenase
LANGGSYFLPYQLHATSEQFKQAYPGAEQFFKLKSKLDPTNNFRNLLLERYLPAVAVQD